MKRLLAAAVAVAAAVTLAGCGGTSTATPLHVASVFADGENHGDFRQSCAQVDPKIIKKLWGSLSGCEGYFTVAFSQAVFGGGWGSYRIVPHSEKIHKDFVTVQMKWAGGVDVITLVKVNGAWKVESVA